MVSRRASRKSYSWDQVGERVSSTSVISAWSMGCGKEWWWCEWACTGTDREERPHGRHEGASTPTGAHATHPEVVVDPLGGQVGGGGHRLAERRLGGALRRDDVLARHEVLDEHAEVVPWCRLCGCEVWMVGRHMQSAKQNRHGNRPPKQNTAYSRLCYVPWVAERWRA